jgi:hypothetical protein
MKMIQKKLTTILFLITSVFTINAQDNVGIGTNTPNASAKLHVDANDKGVLIPRLTATQRLAIPTPANGLLVYDTDSACFFFFNQVATSWQSLCTGGSGTGSGATGATGPTGPQGIVGVTGPTGATGLNGTPCWDMNGNGINDPSEDINSDGVWDANDCAGSASVGPTGPTGPSGTNGATGPTGANGSNGATGPTGATGTAGTNGTTGATGATGPTGVNGTNGTNGATGATGATGPTGTFSVNAWLITGNVGTNPTTNWIGTNDNFDWVMRTNNLERARIVNDGRYLVNLATPNAGERFTVNAGAGFDAVNGYATATENGVYGQNTGGAGSGVTGVNNSSGTGVFGYNNSTGVGVYGWNELRSVGVEGDVFSTPVTAITTGTSVGVYGYNNNNPSSSGAAVGTYGIAVATSGTTYGVIGSAASATGFGVRGGNTHTSGTGVMAVGNNATGQYLTGGSGGAFTGTAVGALSLATTVAGSTGLLATGNNVALGTLVSGSGVAGNGLEIGVYGNATSAANIDRAGGYFSTNAGQSFAYVGYREAGGTLRKIAGNGTVNTIVKDLNGKSVLLSCPEAPENLFEDYGKGKLVNGYAHIDIDPIFAKNVIINNEHPLRVFIQLEGECNGVFVTNKTSNGFDVVELANGKSNVNFMYHIVANRADEVLPDGSVSRYSVERFAPAPQARPTNILDSKVAEEITTPEPAAKRAKQPSKKNK